MTSIAQIKHGYHRVFIRSPSIKKIHLCQASKTDECFDCIASAFLCQRDSLFSCGPPYFLANSATRDFFNNFKVNASLGCCDSV